MKIVDLSSVPRSSENFEAFIDQTCRKLGLDYGSYGTVDPKSGQVVGYATYSRQWKEHYVANNLQEVDPTIHKSALSVAPVDWSRFDRDEKFHRIFRAAHDFGIAAQGISVPIRGAFGERGLLNVTVTMPEAEWKKLSRQIIGELQLAAVHLHDAAIQTGILLPGLTRPMLSTREREVLQWVAAGKSQQDVGDILSISSRTVEVHLRSAREKLGALTTVQAVGRAVGLGIIYPR